MTKDDKTPVEKLDEWVDSGIINLTDDEATLNKADVGVCMRSDPDLLASVPDMWKDQIIHAHCTECGDAVFHRNNMPKNLRLVCHECAFEVMLEEPNPQIVTRREGVEQLRAYLKKKGSH